MQESELKRIHRYKKPVDSIWQDKIEAHVKEHGVKSLGPRDNTNIPYAFNDTFLGRNERGDH